MRDAEDAVRGAEGTVRGAKGAVGGFPGRGDVLLQNEYYINTYYNYAHF